MSHVNATELDKSHFFVVIGDTLPRPLRFVLWQCENRSDLVDLFGPLVTYLSYKSSSDRQGTVGDLLRKRGQTSAQARTRLARFPGVELAVVTRTFQNVLVASLPSPTPRREIRRECKSPNRRRCRQRSVIVS